MLADNLIVHILNSGGLPQVPGACWKRTMSRTEKEESKGLTLGTSVTWGRFSTSELLILLSASETTMTIWMKNVPPQLTHLSIWLPVGGVWGDCGISGHGALLHHVREVGFKSLYNLTLLPVHGFLCDEIPSAASCSGCLTPHLPHHYGLPLWDCKPEPILHSLSCFWSCLVFYLSNRKILIQVSLAL